MAFLTPRQRAELKKAERLATMERQQKEGKLRIRQMTEAERQARRVDLGQRSGGTKP